MRPFLILMAPLAASIALTLHLMAKAAKTPVYRMADCFSLPLELRRLLRAIPWDPVAPVLVTQAVTLYLLGVPAIVTASVLLTSLCLCLTAREGR